MALIAYKNKKNKIFYCFPGEENRIPGYNEKDFQRLPPNPVVVQSSLYVMSDQPALDCLYTAHELNDKLSQDAAYERETKTYLEHRKNM